LLATQEGGQLLPPLLRREKQGEGGKKIIQKIKRTKKKYNKRRYIKIAKSKYNTKIFLLKTKLNKSNKFLNFKEEFNFGSD